MTMPSLHRLFAMPTRHPVPDVCHRLVSEAQSSAHRSKSFVAKVLEGVRKAGAEDALEPILFPPDDGSSSGSAGAGAGASAGSGGATSSPAVGGVGASSSQEVHHAPAPAPAQAKKAKKRAVVAPAPALAKTPKAKKAETTAGEPAPKRRKLIAAVDAEAAAGLTQLAQQGSAAAQGDSGTTGGSRQRTRPTKFNAFVL